MKLLAPIALFLLTVSAPAQVVLRRLFRMLKFEHRSSNNISRAIPALAPVPTAMRGTGRGADAAAHIFVQADMLRFATRVTSQEKWSLDIATNTE
ncbi:MAG: hypothetical protein JOZ13_10055 [Alphaproteobacteria bacterium]|nr:hypothetical protein [Alphaproteobacteria bacterium]